MTIQEDSMEVKGLHISQEPAIHNTAYDFFPAGSGWKLIVNTS